MLSLDLQVHEFCCSRCNGQSDLPLSHQRRRRKHVICICYTSDSQIQWKKWVPNQEQDVSCTRDEKSKPPLNKMMGRLDEKLKNTWPQLHLVLVILKGSWNKYGTKSWTWVIYKIILNNYMAPPILGSFWVQALLTKQCSHQVSLKFRLLNDLYPQFFESILWPCQWAMCIKDTTFHQPTKQRSKRLTCLTEILNPSFRTPEKPQVFTVRLQRSSSGTLGLQLRGLDVVTWHVTTFDGWKIGDGETI